MSQPFFQCQKATSARGHLKKHPLRGNIKPDKAPLLQVRAIEDNVSQWRVCIVDTGKQNWVPYLLKCVDKYSVEKFDVVEVLLAETVNDRNANVTMPLFRKKSTASQEKRRHLPRHPK